MRRVEGRACRPLRGNAVLHCGLPAACLGGARQSFNTARVWPPALPGAQAHDTPASRSLGQALTSHELVHAGLGQSVMLASALIVVPAATFVPLTSMVADGKRW